MSRPTCRTAEEREHSEQPPEDSRPDRYALQLWPLSSPGEVAILRGSR